MLLVIKVSGKVLDAHSDRTELCRQISRLDQEGLRILLVHGAGRQLTDFCGRLGIPTIQFEGRRVTDQATLEAAKMVFSAVNCDLVAALLAAGSHPIGISAFDAGIVTSHRRPPMPVADPEAGDRRHLVDFGWVAEVEQIETRLLHEFWRLRLLPVMNCLCADGSGQMLNMNADTLAAELGVALKADRLLAVSDVEGVFLDLNDPASLIRSLSADEARRHLQAGRLSGGMIPKIEAALSVLERGVRSVQIVSGIRPNALLEALQGEAGTLLS